MPTTHVVFTNGRSGSNFIVDVLNQHPLLCNYGEVLGEYMPTRKLHDRFSYGGRSVESYLDFVLTSRTHFTIAQAYSANAHRRAKRPLRIKRWSQMASVGAKDFGIRFEREGLDDYLVERPEFKVISLVRENTLARVLSSLRLRTTGEIAAKSGSERPPLQVDIDLMLTELSRFDAEKVHQLAIVDRLAPGQVMAFTYEEFFTDVERQAELLRGLFAFLGVDPIPVKPRFQKIASNQIEGAVANHEDVVAALRGTRFEPQLELS